MSEFDKERIYDTYATEEHAKIAAQRLLLKGRSAVAMSVREMALANDPLTPRTANPWCVIVKGQPI